MADCATLHHFARSLTRQRVPFGEGAIPKNGLYVLFEEGEEAHGGERIVRVGTHTGEGQLPSRLRQHFVVENKDRSIFRKNIGRALLAKAGDSFLQLWEVDRTPRAAREYWAGKIDEAKQARIERQVTEYMREHFSFALLKVEHPKERLSLESKIISTLSLCEACLPSAGWLGRHSPKEKIRESGLWLVNELYKTPLSGEDFIHLQLL